MTQALDLGLAPPRYQQLAQALAQRIGSGEYRVGSLIPPEEELCREFGLSRFTVRQALGHLQQTGMVERRRGVGTEVVAATPPRTFAHTISSIEQLQQYAQQTRLTRHRMQAVSADAALAAELGCAVGERFLRIDALRVPADEPRADPIAWTRIHLIEAYAGVKPQLKTFNGAIGTLVEQLYSERISAIEQTISAVDIDAEIAERLKVPAGSSGLRIDRRYLGRNGKPFEFVTTIHPGARFSLSMRLDRSKPL